MESVISDSSGTRNATRATERASRQRRAMAPPRLRSGSWPAPQRSPTLFAATANPTECTHRHRSRVADRIPHSRVHRQRQRTPRRRNPPQPMRKAALPTALCSRYSLSDYQPRLSHAQHPVVCPTSLIRNANRLTIVEATHVIFGHETHAQGVGQLEVESTARDDRHIRGRRANGSYGQLVRMAPTPASTKSTIPCQPR
jgi:hypothetical protein